jgi:hypothetical protein
MCNTQLSHIVEIATQQQLIVVPESRQTMLYDNVSMIKAQAVGLQAIAEKAITDGDIDPEDLHSLANLATQIKGHLGQLSFLIAELNDQGQ